MNDLISRQNTADVMERWLYDGEDERTVREVVCELPSADLKLMAERCIPEECKDDLVSRREVYRLKLMSVTDWDFGQALINLPSAESERKIGKWIWSPERGYKCDNCHIIWMEMVYPRNFCPNCGADMRGDSE